MANMGNVEGMAEPGDTSSPQYAASAAWVLGAEKAVFATKDFFATGAGLWGDIPKEEDRSEFRQGVDAESARLSDKFGMGYSLSEGLAQGAVGMLGVGKVMTGLGVAKGAAALVSQIAAFEPHAQNFANMAGSIPGIGPTLEAYLGSHDTDSTFHGYLKNGLVSLGFDAAVVGLFSASAAMVKAFSSGDRDAIAAAQANLAQAAKDHQAAQEAAQAPATAGGKPSTTSSPPNSPLSSNSGQPSSLEGLPSGSSGPSGTSAPSSPEGSAPAAANDNAGQLSAAPTDQQAITPPGEAPAGAVNDNLSLAGRPALQPRFEISTDAVSGLIDSVANDRAALDKWGTWENAVANGHVFGTTEKTPWQFIGDGSGAGPSTSMDALIGRMKEAYLDQWNEMKGGEVQTDAINAEAVGRWEKLWGQDPTTFLGVMSQAGDKAAELRATMEAAYTVGLRILMDSHGLSARIAAGEFGAYGNKEAAVLALKQQIGMASQVFGAANSISANVGRALRGLQGQFRPDPLMVRALAGADGDRLVQMLVDTGGDPANLRAAIKPTLLGQIGDWAQFLRVNNLVSSIKTHLIIAGSNLWQVGARPGMRMFGAKVMDAKDALMGGPGGNYASVGMQAQKQYAYYASVIPDALSSAWQAFKAGDSILAPHDAAAAQEAGSGGSMASSGIAQQIAQMQWSKMDTPANILRNVGVAITKSVAIPTRLVGFQDEFVKQVVYRAFIKADAAVEGIGMGLKDGSQDLIDHVNDRLAGAFNRWGQGTDKVALQEAKVATFQNDLEASGWLGATQGAKAQQFLQNNPAGRIVVPFLKTPVNLFRQGVQLTPGLNVFQTEYREMLTGARGAQQQAQAIGQMGMGALIMGTMGILAHQGMVTGDGPSDPKGLADAMKTGWRPNSFVKVNADGSRTYIPYDRFDPVMMPMAMAANIVSVMMQPDMANQNKAQSMLAAMSLGLLKQLVDKSYMKSVKDTLDVALYPDKNLAKWAGQMAGGYVPMSSALHLFNTDPVMREADTFCSSMLGQVPGFSTMFPPQRDYAGDPVSVHKGLWVDTPAGKADAEVQRLALQQGGDIGAPSYRAKGGADLREITLKGDKDPEAAGRTAYDRFQELAGHPERAHNGNPNAVPLRDAIANLVSSPAYQRLPDGDSQTKDTKLWRLTGLIHEYRQTALDRIQADGNVRAAENAEQHRVLSQLGTLSGSPPTPTNQANGLMQRLGSVVGLSSLRVPNPATPTTALPGGGGGGGGQ